MTYTEDEIKRMRATLTSEGFFTEVPEVIHVEDEPPHEIAHYPDNPLKTAFQIPVPASLVPRKGLFPGVRLALYTVQTIQWQAWHTIKVEFQPKNNRVVLHGYKEIVAIRFPVLEPEV
jgi:hypothetical protein